MIPFSWELAFLQQSRFSLPFTGRQERNYMAVNRSTSKKEILNQLVNLFWTILCFTPVLWFWIKEGINLYFYIALAISILIGILPEKILKLFLLSSNRRFYEKLGVKAIRKFVQNGDIVNAMTDKQKQASIKGRLQAQQYLKTIAMYERFHWICFTFFLLTAINCFLKGYVKLGVAVTAANLIYNLGSILLQQYNGIRIRRLTV